MALKEYELPAYDAGILTESRHLAGLFEETAVLLGNPKKVANWFMVEVLRLTKDKGLDPEKIGRAHVCQDFLRRKQFFSETRRRWQTGLWWRFSA